nr:MAG TPA: hypothetical protein [Caudoviricetes sp.]
MPIKYIIKSFTYQCCIFIFKSLHDIINYTRILLLSWSYAY